MVIAEAMMSGLPVIASNLGAIPEFVHHGLKWIAFFDRQPRSNGKRS
jgi:glycosyltransferase involved in cell wall biosynthesis